MSHLKNRLLSDIKEAMLKKDKEKLITLRSLNAAVKQIEIDKRIELSDTDIVVILDKQAKQRRESISQFKAANRVDLLQKEEYELKIIQSYLPQQLSESEISQQIKNAIDKTAATSIKDMGKVMALLKPRMQGVADLSIVSKKIKDILQ
ncbi:MAG: GatB/YqeY domain-containing protein [Gammaproteobacteria bacterium]|nr:MAG: GatB/YqeY domain-containing protein [Gammaproteobacteria bacterium]